MLSRERPRPDANSDDTSFLIQRASCSRYVFGCRSGTWCLIANTRAVLRELYVFPVSMTISITSMSFSRHTRIPGLGNGLHPLTALCLCLWKKTLVPLWVTEKMNRDLRDLAIDMFFSCLSRAIVYGSTLDITIRPFPVYILQVLEKNATNPCHSFILHTSNSDSTKAHASRLILMHAIQCLALYCICCSGRSRLKCPPNDEICCRTTPRLVYYCSVCTPTR